MTKKRDRDKHLDVITEQAYRDSIAREKHLRRSMKNSKGSADAGLAPKRGPQRDYREKKAERRARAEANDVVKRESPPWPVQVFLKDAGTYAHRLTPMERAILLLKWGRPNRTPKLAEIARDLGGADYSTVSASYQRALAECEWMARVIQPIIWKREAREKLTPEERAAWRKFQEPRGGRAVVSGMWVEPYEEMRKLPDEGRTSKKV